MDLNDSMVTAASSGILSGVLAGLVMHQFYKRWEPSIYEFLLHLLCFVVIHYYVLAPFINPISDHRTETIKALCGYLDALAISIAVYRLFLHPLRSYPGPISCRLTRFIASWHVLKRDSHKWMAELHRQYGDIVRVSPNELSYISASSVEWIHGAKANKLARGPFYAGDPNRPADSMLSTQDLNEHRWRRRGWERGFGTVQLKEYEPRVLKHLEVLVSQLNARDKQTINMTNWCEFFAYDVMSDLAFSEDFGMLKEAKPHRYISALHGATRILTIAAQTPWVRPLMSLFPVDRQSKLDGKEFARISMDTYRRRKERQPSQRDMFGYLAAKKAEGGRALTEAELIADTSLLIAAGAVSTALCITFIFRYICDDRAKFDRLQKEIDSCWSGESPLQVSALGPNTAPYLNGVINESLRLWPPAPNGMQRRTPPEGISVDGSVVPGGTQISVNTMGTQRDERHFTNPDEFLPERWIDAERPKTYNHDTRAFIPFTVGQFACLGKNLAYQEIRLFMAVVLHHFNFRLEESFNPVAWEETILYKGTFLVQSLPIVVTKR
ncbi:cytochrome P450 [Aspergillus sergii]|uniref:Cytochrome P450 n=1 Tax=Aspergillus sergii TaxID=1034303 RepID=A0A5N6XDX8_9EURO|nr:cytochrome P450 [Aspergillus sergii]